MYVKKLNEDMDGLEVLFQARDNKLIEITQEDKEETKDINFKIQQKDKELKNLLDNLKVNILTSNFPLKIINPVKKRKNGIFNRS